MLFLIGSYTFYSMSVVENIFTTDERSRKHFYYALKYFSIFFIFFWKLMILYLYRYPIIIIFYSLTANFKIAYLPL